MRSFSFGVLITSSFGDSGVDPGVLGVLASDLGDLGVDALFVRTSAVDAVEPLTALSAIAAVSDLVLGAVISLESGRNPAIVAKMATTLALLAPARAALIFDTDRAKDSLRLLEALEVAASLRGDGPLSAGGAEFFVRGAYNEPRPAAADALGVGAIVDQATPELISVCDLVIVRSADKSATRDDPRIVPLFRPASPGPGDVGAPCVAEVDANSVDQVIDVVAAVAPRRT